MSHRSLQVASVLRRALQTFFAGGDLADPRMSGVLVTVTDVRVTDDMQTAVVGVSVIPESKQKLAVHALRHSARHIRHQISDEVALRRVPQLVFRVDQAIKKQAAVLGALAAIEAERDESRDEVEAADQEPREDEVRDQ